MTGWYCSYYSSATYEVSSLCGAASKISSTLQSQNICKGGYPTAKNCTMMVLEGTEERPLTMLTSRQAWSFSNQAKPTSFVTSHFLNHILQHFHVQVIKCDNRNNVLRNTLGLHSTCVGDHNSARTVELTGPNSSQERSACAFTSE